MDSTKNVEYINMDSTIAESMNTVKRLVAKNVEYINMDSTIAVNESFVHKHGQYNSWVNE